jgi:hypothetical protein
MKILKMLNTTFKKNYPAESIVLTGLLHDVCKVNIYKTEARNRKVDGK